MKPIYVLITLSLLASCAKPTSDTLEGSGERILVVNQGGFNRGEGSMSLIQPETRTVADDVFLAKNGRPLGDIAQSVTEFAGRLYIVVNNSHKVEVVASDDYRSLGTIAIPNNASPRYMGITNNNRGYITNLYSDSVTVVDLSTLGVLNQIHVGAGTEGILISNDTAFVAKNLNADFSSANEIALIRTGSGTVVANWETGTGPTQIAVHGSVVIVSCTGSYGQNDGEIVVHDRTSGEIIRRIPLNTYAGGFALGSGNNLYVLANGVKQVNISTGFSITLLDKSFYAIAHDGDELWLTDALNFAQAGMLYRYSVSGAVSDSFRVGIIPGHIHFQQE
jgi:YVTN family beta-propeller protein